MKLSKKISTINKNKAIDIAVGVIKEVLETMNIEKYEITTDSDDNIIIKYEKIEKN